MAVKRYATIFWWTLTALPFIYILFVLVGCIANFNTLGGTPSVADTIANCFNQAFTNACTNVANIFGDFSINYFTSNFDRMFDILGVPDSTFWSIVVSYMLTIQCVHVLFDVLVWLPHMAHELLERWC